MAETAQRQDWTQPAAMAIPKEGYFELEQGRYGPVYPQDARVPRIHASSPRSSRGGRTPSASTAKRSRRRSPGCRTRWRS